MDDGDSNRNDTVFGSTVNFDHILVRYYYIE